MSDVTQSQPAPASGSGGQTRTLLVVVLIVLVVVLLVLGGVVVFSGGDGGGGAAAGASVRTEPVSTANDPFAPAGQVGQDQSVPPVQTSQPTLVEGGHVGLYGGTLNNQVCDKTQLVTFLQQNPAKAAAWAGVLGISVAQIPTYIAGLTPVLLRSDTLVTNHGYANGRATTIPAVLQAGTAVLVDDKGVPVTKCYCGNPLTPPTYYTPGKPPTYYGPKWPGWSPTSITIIRINVTVITIFTLVDVTTGGPIYINVGGTTPTATNPATQQLPAAPVDPCVFDYSAPGCPGYVPPPPEPQYVDPCASDYTAPGCPGYVPPQQHVDPCAADPYAPGCPGYVPPQHEDPCTADPHSPGCPGYPPDTGPCATAPPGTCYY